MGRLSIDTGRYRLSHGTRPRGHGVWSFHLQQRSSGFKQDWSPSLPCSYSSAVRQLERHLREEGIAPQQLTISVNS